jgi:hypothetical protein
MRPNLLLHQITITYFCTYAPTITYNNFYHCVNDRKGEYPNAESDTDSESREIAAFSLYCLNKNARQICDRGKSVNARMACARAKIPRERENAAISCDSRSASDSAKKKNQSTEERQCYSTSMPWLKRYECETEGNTKSECRLLLLFLTKGQEYLISSLLFGFFYTASNTSRSILLSASRIPLAQPSSSRRASKSRA